MVATRSGFEYGHSPEPNDVAVPTTAAVVEDDSQLSGVNSALSDLTSVVDGGNVDGAPTEDGCQAETEVNPQFEVTTNSTPVDEPAVFVMTGMINGNGERDGERDAVSERRAGSPDGEPPLCQAKSAMIPSAVDRWMADVPLRSDSAEDAKMHAVQSKRGSISEDEQGFIHPRSPVKHMLRSRSAPALQSNPHFFPHWFDNEPSREDSASYKISWADASDDGSIGSIPSIRRDHPRTPNRHTPLVSVNVDQTPLSEIMWHVLEGPNGAEAHQVLDRRMSGLWIKETPDFKSIDSDTSSESWPIRYRAASARKRGRKSKQRLGISPVTLSVIKFNSGKGGDGQRPEPSASKGKGVDPLEKSGVPPSSPTFPDSDDEDLSVLREEQINEDYRLAMRLQEVLDARAAEDQRMRDQLRDLRDRLSGIPEVKNRNPVDGSVDNSHVDDKEEDRKTSSRKRKRQHKDEIKAKGRHDRASSQLPKGSNLRRALVGVSPSSDPSSSDSSSSSSSSESSSARNSDDGSSSSDSTLFPDEPDSVHSSDSEATKSKKRREKRRYKKKMLRLKYQQSFLKIDPPFICNGEVRAETYKKWVREVRLFLKFSGLSNAKGLLVIGKYLTGRAYKWYDREVLNARRRFTLSEFFTGLFDYLFPHDFRTQQRDRFDACTQRGQSVRDFLQNLRDITDTVGDYSERDLVLAFWRRCDPYLRSGLQLKGYSGETMSLKCLETEAERVERAHKPSSSDKSEKMPHDSDDRRDSRKVTRDKTRESGKKDTPGRPEDKPNDAIGVKHSSGTADKSSNKRGHHTNKSSQRQTREEQRQKYHDEGHCFECGSKDHMVKDCPERHTKKPPSSSLRSATVDVDEIEHLQSLLVRAAQSLGLVMLEVSKYTETVEERSLKDQILVDSTLARLFQAVPLALDEEHNPRVSPYSEDRFSMLRITNEPFILTDWHTSETHELFREDLMNPSFDVVHWLFKQKAMRFEELLRVPEEPRTRWVFECCDSDTESAASDADCKDSGSEVSDWEVSVDDSESDVPGLIDCDSDSEDEEEVSVGDSYSDVPGFVDCDSDFEDEEGPSVVPLSSARPTKTKRQDRDLPDSNSLDVWPNFVGRNLVYNYCFT
ncbi:hypothetical protein BU15DRAFT_79141 [Melanogaster broomeanus]|nr:hypothetical protein BU15DRAFT_79141 [Melanogaster broomeanus]